MKVLAATIVTISFLFLLPRGTQMSAATVAIPPLSVHAANAFCRSHPAGSERIWLHGWFIPVAEGTFVDGGLFDSQEALPLVTVNAWDVNGNWRRYGAVYLHIRTRTPIGPRSITVHGLLDCATARLVTDRDPFALPPLTTSYGAAKVESNGAVSTWAMSGGLKLTLVVPRRSYPRNALANVQVTLRNVTNHDLGYWLTGMDPVGYAAPQAEVLNAAGTIVFPPAMPYMPALPGPVPGLAPLHSGQSVTQSEYIVLRGARIRATQNFMPRMMSNLSLPPYVLTTRPILVRLTSEPAPKLILHGDPSHPVLDVTRPPNIQGPMWSVRYADCGFQSTGPTYTYTEGWVASNLHMTPGCSPLAGWYVRVAWLNHPVAALDYIPPRASPTPRPTPSPTVVPTPTRVVPSSPSFTSLLRKAAVAMASVHALHAEGTRTSVDSSTRQNLQIHADCSSQSGGALPISLRTLVSGRESRVGKIDEGYIISGPVLPAPHTVIHAWHRTITTHESWRAVDLHTQPGWGLSDNPAFTPDPAYVNQVCPDVLRLTYLTSPVGTPFTQRSVLGTELLAGHRVWHLSEQLWFKADLYLDTVTFRLRRLLLWNGVAPGARWQIRFDYSRFNVPVHFASPAGARSAS
jgi:hypothetical protein